jgi:hypothetical protein
MGGKLTLGSELGGYTLMRRLGTSPADLAGEVGTPVFQFGFPVPVSTSCRKLPRMYWSQPLTQPA